MVLGVLFFIGGQWWGLSLSETKKRIDSAPTPEVIHAEDSVPDAQNGSASEPKKEVD